MISPDSNNSEFVVVALLESLSKDVPYIKAREFSENPDRFANGKTLYVEFFGKMKPVVIESTFQRKTAFFISFKNFTTPEECEVLLGKNVCIPAAELAPLPSDAFYIHDLIGSEVKSTDAVLGVISDVMNLPANDVYVVKQNNGDELLIPALKSLIKLFDPKTKVLELTVHSTYFVDEI